MSEAANGKCPLDATEAGLTGISDIPLFGGIIGVGSAMVVSITISFPELILIGWKLAGAGTPLTTWQLDIPQLIGSRWG
jgi:hypothetical protein